MLKNQKDIRLLINGYLFFCIFAIEIMHLYDKYKNIKLIFLRYYQNG